MARPKNKAAEKVVKDIFPKAKVAFGIYMVVSNVGDPRVSQVEKLRKRLLRKKLINKETHVGCHYDDKLAEEFVLSCVLLTD